MTTFIRRILGMLKRLQCFIESAEFQKHRAIRQPCSGKIRRQRQAFLVMSLRASEIVGLFRFPSVFKKIASVVHSSIP